MHQDWLHCLLQMQSHCCPHALLRTAREAQQRCPHALHFLYLPCLWQQRVRAQRTHQQRCTHAFQPRVGGAGGAGAGHHNHRQVIVFHVCRGCSLWWCCSCGIGSRGGLLGAAAAAAALCCCGGALEAFCTVGDDEGAQLMQHAQRRSNITFRRCPSSLHTLESELLLVLAARQLHTQLQRIQGKHHGFALQPHLPQATTPPTRPTRKAVLDGGCSSSSLVMHPSGAPVRTPPADALGVVPQHPTALLAVQG
mmetsp:Transcript_7982/g.19602  ORF Transcript_7982/g.19602 Transcript_7982/m.19602 type:complete len:252 (-) Transcript_7982:305-1060(-)